MNKTKRIVVIGIDGMDPDVFRILHARGHMPVLGALADRGTFKELSTSNPPQSPVSWTSISTGSDPGAHGIYDFLKRNPETYMPELSLFGIKKHKGGVRYISNIKTSSVFELAMKRGVHVTLLRWPLTFPVLYKWPKKNILLSGMGVPDLLGTLGRYAYYTADHLITEKEKHGRIIHIKPDRNVVKTKLYGPKYFGWTGMKEASVPMVLEKTFDGLKIILPDITFNLTKNEWSPHLRIQFSIGSMRKVTAVTRMVYIESKPFPSLFVLPMQIYPKDTEMPLSLPAEFAGELWDKIGPYLTLGMPEDTNGLKDGLIPEDVFVKLCEEVFNEREKMLNATVENFDEGIYACVFDTLDRIQHMFWQEKNTSSGLNDTKEPTKIVEGWYRRIDTLIGELIKKIGENTPLLILSDHGFMSLKKYVHLNSWLVQNGFIILKHGDKIGGPFFENVDWSKTRAYALGFNSIYLNIKGREGKGIVEQDESEALCLELIGKLQKWTEDGKAVIKQIYNSKEIYSDSLSDNVPELIVGYQKGYRASKQTVLGESPSGKLVVENHEKWCGDHCCDPSFVPGVLFWANLQHTGIMMPDRISVNDIRAIIEKAISNGD